MNKKLLYSILGIILFFLILFFAFNFQYTDKSLLIKRSEIKLPVNSEVSEIYSSVEGIFADGERLIKIVTSDNNLKDTDLFKNGNKTINHIDKRIVKSIIEKSKVKLKLDEMKYIKTIQTSNPDYTLVIMYNPIDKNYYLFENKI